MHCKVINDGKIIGYSGVYLDENYNFIFKDKEILFAEVQNNQLYFFCIFNAINSLYPSNTKEGRKKIIYKLI